MTKANDKGAKKMTQGIHTIKLNNGVTVLAHENGNAWKSPNWTGAMAKRDSLIAQGIKCRTYQKVLGRPIFIAIGFSQNEMIEEG